MLRKLIYFRIFYWFNKSFCYFLLLVITFDNHIVNISRDFLWNKKVWQTNCWKVFLKLHFCLWNLNRVKKIAKSVPKNNLKQVSLVSYHSRSSHCFLSLSISSSKCLGKSEISSTDFSFVNKSRSSAVKYLKFGLGLYSLK